MNDNKLYTNTNYLDNDLSNQLRNDGESEHLENKHEEGSDEEIRVNNRYGAKVRISEENEEYNEGDEIGDIEDNEDENKTFNDIEKDVYMYKCSFCFGYGSFGESCGRCWDEDNGYIGWYTDHKLTKDQCDHLYELTTEHNVIEQEWFKKMVYNDNTNDNNNNNDYGDDVDDYDDDIIDDDDDDEDDNDKHEDYDDDDKDIAMK